MTEVKQRARRVPRLPLTIAGKSRTKQSFTAECDINTIMKKFEKTGVIEHVKQHAGRYGDFLAAPQSFQEACNLVIEAERMFLSLPAKVRRAFDNDPGVLLSALESAKTDPAIHKQLQEIGLLKTNAPTGAPQGVVDEPEKAPKEPETPPSS